MNNDYEYNGTYENIPSFQERNNFATNNMDIKPPKKRRKWPIVLLILLLLIVGVLIYFTFFTDKLDFIKPNDNYSEFDPDKGKIESNSNVEIKSNITSNKQSNTNIDVEKIVITPTTPSVVVGSKITLKTTITPSDANDKSITWKSGDTKIATINSNGVVTGVKAGTTTITATSKNGKKASVKVTVTTKKIPVTGVKLVTSEINMGYNGIATLLYKITPSNATNKNIKWSSSNSSIVTVDQTGFIKGVGPGTAYITATTVDGNKSATCKVNVSAPAISSIKISSPYYIYIGEPQKATVTYVPSVASGQSVKWSISDTSIATINSNGVIYGIKEGNVTITATTPNGVKASKNVYIRENPDYYSVLVLRNAAGGGEHGTHYIYTFIVPKNNEQIYNIDSVMYNSKSYKIGYFYSESEITIDKSITKVNLTPSTGMRLYNVSVKYEF